MNGDAFSYGTGQRTQTAYSMNLDQIEKKLKAIDDEIDEIESQLNGSVPRFVAGFLPCDW